MKNKSIYESNMYNGVMAEIDVSESENRVPSEYLNRIFCKSCENMEELPNNSIHLVVTSPPYNVMKDYDKNMTLVEYRQFLQNVWKECYRVLTNGGRICINIANIGRKPYIPLHRYVIEDMLNIGFSMRGEIIWNKGSSVGSSTAWGSWLSASNPVLRDVHEYILVFSKGSFERSSEGKQSTIRKEDFLEWTKSIWTFPTVSARKIGHPAPFPEELPFRLIQLYTFKDDIVLDPFAGSGTTCLVASKLYRHYVGYETEYEYIKIAERRMKQHTDQLDLFA